MVLSAAASYGSKPELAAAVTPYGLPATSLLPITTGAGEGITLSLAVPAASGVANPSRVCTPLAAALDPSTGASLVDATALGSRAGARSIAPPEPPLSWQN
jgi:hypothetical protein